MKTLVHNFASQQTELRSEAAAVVMQGEVVTYGQLEERSNRFARLLRDAGCGQGDRVCLAIPKSPMAIVAIAGILKADCVYVPIDIASPATRVAKLLDSAAPRFILGSWATANLLDQLFEHNRFRDSIRVGWMEGETAESQNVKPAFHWHDVNSYSAEALAQSNTSADPAQILFTSGSTGDPKGVVITHANVIHFVEWAVRYFGISDSDRISGHPPLHFDLATFDIFGTFAAGAQLHLVPPESHYLLPNKLTEFIRGAQLTQWFSVPSVLNYMAKFDVVRFNDFPTLRRLLWCGEVFPTPALAYWMKRLPQVTFTNLYGPTETTIASSYYTVSHCPTDTQPIPIGTACDGEELLVMDGELHPVPQGEVGDLYVGGVGLSPGYWSDPVKTSSAFSPYQNQRIYRTGDLARVGEDGLVYFVGRADTQIKSRGYRIELGEIEAALNTFEELKECAVVALPTDGFEGNMICCAYVAQDDVHVRHAGIRSKLSTLLPAYMLPSRWQSFTQLPKNANGKIDRRKIQDLFALEVTNGFTSKPPGSNLAGSAVDCRLTESADAAATSGSSIASLDLLHPRTR
jgi:amino acid adenylation domain-containing protein